MLVVDFVKVYWQESYGDHVLSEACGVKVKFCFDCLVCFLRTSTRCYYVQDKWARPVSLPKTQRSFGNWGASTRRSFFLNFVFPCITV